MNKYKKKKQLKNKTRLKPRLIFLALCVFALIIFTRIFWIQRKEGDYWRKKGEKTNIKVEVVQPIRGNIYSDDKSMLATSQTFFYIAMDPTLINEKKDAKQLDTLCHNFSTYFNEHSKEWYHDKILRLKDKKRQYFKVSNKSIKYMDLKNIKNWPLVRRGRTKGGFFIEKKEQRVKPFNQLAKRTIGYKTEDGNGAGIEYSFDKYLKGKQGKVLCKRIPNGNWRPINDEEQVPAIDGKDVYTTLNINLQDIATSALKKELLKNKAEYGCVALMEVKTGDIKAIANLMEVKGSKGTQYVEGYNYLVGQSTEPGSTIKLAAALALMEKSNIRPEDIINTQNGKYIFSDREMIDYQSGGFGKIPFQTVFEKSSNIGISKEIVRVFGHRPQEYIDFLKKLNLDKTIDIGLEGAGKPYIKKPGDKSWSGTTLPWMSIGYELRLSPLHTLMLYNAVANDGVMVKPRLVKQISDANHIIKKFDIKENKGKICSEKTLKNIQSFLEGVVERGTAVNIKDKHIKIAGKTGTAKIYKQGEGYQKKYYTSFAGYFPSKNPKYSCIVIIANPKGYHQYGSDVAAPVFKLIANKINTQDLQLRDMRKIDDVKHKQNKAFPLIKGGYRAEIESLLNQFNINYKEKTTAKWIKTKRDGNNVVISDIALKPNTVPSVIGLTLRDALFLLEKNGLDVSFAGLGRVEKQSLTPGQLITDEKQIKLTLN